MDAPLAATGSAPVPLRPARERKPSSRLRDAILDGPYYHNAVTLAARPAARPRAQLQAVAVSPVDTPMASGPPASCSWANATAAPQFTAESFWATTCADDAADADVIAAEDLWGRAHGSEAHDEVCNEAEGSVAPTADQ